MYQITKEKMAALTAKLRQIRKDSEEGLLMLEHLTDGQENRRNEEDEYDPDDYSGKWLRGLFRTAFFSKMNKEEKKTDEQH